MIDINSLKKNIKTNLKRRAKKFLSSEVQEELGISKMSTASFDQASADDFNTFWAPVQSNLLSQKRKESLSTWMIGIVAAMILILFILIFTLLSPSKNYQASNGNEVVVNGKAKKKIVSEAKADKESSQKEEEAIKVTNIKMERNDVKSSANQSPLLSSNSGSIVEYKVRSGDTIERIAVKFYGEFNSEIIKKIKLANKIRNPRSLQIGQKLIIPF